MKEEPTGQQQPEAMETVIVNKCKEIYPLQSAFDTSRFYEGFKQGVIYAGSSEAESMLGAMARKQFDLLQERAQLRAEVERLKSEYEILLAQIKDHDEFKSGFRNGVRNEQELVSIAQAEEIKRLKEVTNAFIKTLEIAMPNVAAPIRDTFELAIAKAKDKLHSNGKA